MVTNLPAEAIAKLNKYSDAKTVEDKIKALEEFISAVPKHKGTENLLYWARSRLAELRQEEEKERRKKKGGGPRIFIEKAGAGQIAIIGPPNSGKSSLMSRLTNAKVVISPNPFSTTDPIPGMMQYEDIQFQLIDTPPIISNEGNYVNTRVLAIARNSDAIIIVIGLDDENYLNTLKRVIDTLEKRGIMISMQKGYIRIIKHRSGNGINVVFYGKPKFTEEDVKKALSSYRIFNATVEIYGEPSLDDIDASLINAITYKPTIVLFNKKDLNNFKGADLPKDVLYKVVSAKTGEGLEDLGKDIFNILKIKRIYTKKPNAPPDKDPLIIREDATIREIAETINHSNIKYAKIWGKGAKYDGQRVGPDFIPKDKDIVEIRF
ncbi:GTPase [Caldisphaera lagunensis]|nr:GTPase [Caldisphaera lagunensis]